MRGEDAERKMQKQKQTGTGGGSCGRASERERPRRPRSSGSGPTESPSLAPRELQDWLWGSSELPALKDVGATGISQVASCQQLLQAEGSELAKPFIPRGTQRVPGWAPASGCQSRVPASQAAADLPALPRPALLCPGQASVPTSLPARLIRAREKLARGPPSPELTARAAAPERPVAEGSGGGGGCAGPELLTAAPAAPAAERELEGRRRGGGTCRLAHPCP